MRMLVLAGGFGTRLQPVLADFPKALAPVGKVPFLRFQIEHWISQGLRSFVFLLHHQADLVIGFLNGEQDGLLRNCAVRYLVEPTPLGTGGAIAYAVEQLQLAGDFLICNADTWLGAGIEAVSQAAAPAMAVVDLADTSRYGGVRLDDKQERVIAFQEKTGDKRAGWINAGLCRLSAETFAQWDQKPFSLEQAIFPRLADQGRLNAVALRTDFIDIGIPDDYFRFCRWIATDRKEPLCN